MNQNNLDDTTEIQYITFFTSQHTSEYKKLYYLYNFDVQLQYLNKKKYIKDVNKVSCLLIKKFPFS